MMRLLIGTGNPGKILRWKTYLPEYELVSPLDLNLCIDIKEGMTSLEENSQLKARTYAKASGMTALSEDIGLYVKELGGLPGVALRRWGGVLPEGISDEDFMVFFRKEILPLKDTSALYRIAISIAKPDGSVKTLLHQVSGYVDKERAHSMHIKGFPLSSCFVRNGIDKPWAEMTAQERRDYEKEMIEKVKKSLAVI